MRTDLRDDLSTRGSGSASVFDYLFPLLLGAYMFFGRAFAWLHIPGTPVFIGDIVLVTGLLGAVRALTWSDARRHSQVPLAILLYFTWSGARSIPGLLDDPVVALRDSAIWIYAIVGWAVVGALASRPETIAIWSKKYLAVVPFAVIWLPLTSYLSTLDLGTVPGSDVPITSFGVGLAQVHLAMIVAFLWLVWEPRSGSDVRWRTVISGLAILGLLILGTYSRGGFVAGALGLAMLLVFYPHRTKLVMSVGTMLFVVVAAIVILDPQVEAGERDIAVSQFTDNVRSLVSPEGDAGLDGTVRWRQAHWATILNGVSRDAPLIGHGFGPNIAELYHIPQVDIGLRNAHNSHLTVLARAGWIGLVLWSVVWVTWFLEVSRTRKRLRDSGYSALSGLAGWCLIGVAGLHAEAYFNPSFERPPASFWLWSLAGLGLVLTVMSRRRRGASNEASRETLRQLEASLARMRRSTPGPQSATR